MLHGDRSVTTPTSPWATGSPSSSHQHELDAVLRTADGVQQHLGRVVDARAGDRRRLGARVPHHDRTPEARAHLLGQLGRDRRRAGGASRSDERSASASCGRSTSLLHCVGTPRPTVTRSRTICVEHRLDRPRRAGEHGVDDELDLVPELVHVARVRERHRHEPHVVVRAEDVAEPGRRLQRAVVEPRTLGQSGGAARPHDAHRVAGIATRSVGELGARRPRVGDLGAWHQHLRRRRVAGDREGVALVQQRGRLAPLEDRGDLGRAEAGVDAGCHRAEARARGVRHRVVDARRQPERDDVTRPDATRPQLGGERVGTRQPLAVGQPLVAVDVGERIGLAGADLLEEVAERRADDRRRRAHADASDRGPPVGIDALGRDRALGDQPLAVDDTELVEVPAPVVEPERREHLVVGAHAGAGVGDEVDGGVAREVADRRPLARRAGSDRSRASWARRTPCRRAHRGATAAPRRARA